MTGKRSDFRWIAPDGTIWASRFEWSVYNVLHASSDRYTRTSERDSLSYVQQLSGAVCARCGASEIGKRRHYTPDILFNGQDTDGRKDQEKVGRSYYIECKGYLRGPERTLLRAFCKARPDVDLRIIFQRDFPITKPKPGTPSLTAVGWVTKYLKRPVQVWQGELGEWIEPETAKEPKKAGKRVRTSRKSKADTARNKDDQKPDAVADGTGNTEE